jgi:hypothetical protein
MDLFEHSLAAPVFFLRLLENLDREKWKAAPAFFWYDGYADPTCNTLTKTTQQH